MAARRVAGRRVAQRFQSTAGGPSASSASSHVAAGVAGGGAVVLGVYAWYYFSGVKTTVDAVQGLQESYDKTKRIVAEKAPKSPNEVVEFLRGTVRPYVVLIPGASSYVDSVFDTLDELRETHGEDVNKVLQRGYDEVKQVLKESGGAVNVETGMKVMGVLRRCASELEKVGRKAGKDIVQTLSEKHPEVRQKLGGGYEELKRLVEKNGPEAKKILDDTTERIKTIFSKGSGLEQLDEARELIQKKTSEVSNLAESSSKEAWDEALKEASPYLDKMPDIKKLIDENASKLIAAGMAQGGAAREVLAQVKQVAESDSAKNKQKLQELREFIQKKAEEAQHQGSWNIDQSWKMLQGWIKTMPGGEEALKKVPDVGAFAKLAQNRGEDAKKLTQETYDEILKILEEKGKEAKELAEKSQQDAKKSSS
ncbi:hypothetical protein WOLCODRAFT_122202 [Wolfiporia cocos MD-104 SS10]|uniref:Uncharacterized protein n=1 Tax=Wolfiporia cocos (strain MD-104) TaxID=742152 RepID=A0A2H3K571_WOLCO|nr:hypothetical protein WOLCODRAFT_122202 [Wolfiporia cocos MD-104 SS10]